MIVQYEISSRVQFEIEKGTHRFDSLLIPLSGSFEYLHGEEKRIITAGIPIIFKKGITFEKRVLEPLEYMIVRFSSLSAEGPWLDYKEEDRVRVESSVRYLQAAMEEKASGEVVEHFARDLLLLAAQQPREGEMTAVAAYINEHYQQKLSLDILAEQAGYSKQTLIKKFHQQYRKTPVEYVTALRIDKAKTLLSNTAYPIGRIAELCGFGNTYYFSNTFKKQTSLSPLQYRNSSKL